MSLRIKDSARAFSVGPIRWLDGPGDERPILISQPTAGTPACATAPATLAAKKCPAGPKVPMPPLRLAEQPS